ncbi:MAG: hypothetical protein U0521_22595 [Anaerolineae bacterium]
MPKVGLALRDRQHAEAIPQQRALVDDPVSEHGIQVVARLIRRQDGDLVDGRQPFRPEPRPQNFEIGDEWAGIGSLLPMKSSKPTAAPSAPFASTPASKAVTRKLRRAVGVPGAADEARSWR